MSADDGLSPKMRRRFFRSGDDLALDTATAERLLSLQVHPADALPGYQRVSEALTTAARAPGDKDIDADAVAALAAVAARRWKQTRVPRRWRLSVRLTVLTAIAFLTLGGVAAATGSLPHSAQAVAHDVLDSVGISVPEPSHAPARSDHSAPRRGPTLGPNTAPTTSRNANPRAPAGTTPEHRGPSISRVVGLCRAYLAHNGDQDQPNRRARSPAVQDLAGAAGDPDRIPDYCRHAAVTQRADQPHLGTPPPRGHKPNSRHH